MRFCSCRERLGRLPGIRSQPAGRPSVALWETQTGPDLPVVHGESGDARRVDPRSRFCVFFYFPLRFSFCCSHWTQSGVSRLSPMVQTPSEVLHDFRTQILNIGEVTTSNRPIRDSALVTWRFSDLISRWSKWRIDLLLILNVHPFWGWGCWSLSLLQLGENIFNNFFLQSYGN